MIVLKLGSLPILGITLLCFFSLLFTNHTCFNPTYALILSNGSSFTNFLINSN